MQKLIDPMIFYGLNCRKPLVKIIVAKEILLDDSSLSLLNLIDLKYVYDICFYTYEYIPMHTLCLILKY